MRITYKQAHEVKETNALKACGLLQLCLMRNASGTKLRESEILDIQKLIKDATM